MGFDFFNWETQKRILDPGGFVWKPPSHAPTQFQDRDAMNAYVRGGMGQGGDAGYWAQDITHYQPQQLQMGDDPFRRAQLAQMGQLQGIAGGQQMGAGELAAQRQVSNALAAQQSLARGARGGGAGLAYRNAANNAAALGLSGAGMGQQAAMQDQMNAQGLLGQLGASGRQADIGVANANAQNAMAANQLNSTNYLNLAQLQNQANISKYNADMGIGAQQDAASAAKQGGLLAGAGSLLAAFSDERLKADVEDAGGDVDEMLDALTPKAWVYKDKKHGAGRWTGVMAQDAQKTKAGSRFIVDTDEGLALHTGKTISASLAGLARLNQRVRDLEKGK